MNKYITVFTLNHLCAAFSGPLHHQGLAVYRRALAVPFWRALLLSNVNRQMCFENVDIYQYYSYWHKVL